MAVVQSFKMVCGLLCCTLTCLMFQNEYFSCIHIFHLASVRFQWKGRVHGYSSFLYCSSNEMDGLAIFL
ncbi:hypothetical protein ACP275_08G098400 [Erythranthe tilingii]